MHGITVRKKFCIVTNGILVKCGMPARYIFGSAEYGKPFRSVPNPLFAIQRVKTTGSALIALRCMRCDRVELESVLNPTFWV